MLEYLLSGAALRLAQTIVFSSIWIVIGCLIAAVFRQMMGPPRVRKLFADGTRWGLFCGWLMGMLLPVCSLGVIPVVREMHRAGVQKGTIIAFGLTAPLFNPMSVLYGLTLSDPIAILSFTLCALVIVTLMGSVWNRFFADDESQSQDAQQLPVPGIKRTAALIYSACRELASPSLVFIVIGIFGSVILAVSLGKGHLQNQVDRDNPFAPVVVALVATPVYSTPLLAMSQIGGMFQHGNSIGAAFTLLVLGAGANLGLLGWFGSNFGVKRVLLFYILLFASSVGLAYAIDKPLIPEGVNPAGHTHAFDVYTHPFHRQQSNMMKTALLKINDFWETNEFGGTYTMFGMIVLGAMLTLVQSKFDLESWFCRNPESAKQHSARLDPYLPGWLLGGVCIAGLVAASVVACFMYYPAAEDLLPDLDIINTECVFSARTGDWEAAEKWIGFADDLSRRLEVGVYLRTGQIDEFQSTKAKIYREKLEELKDNRKRTKEISLEVHQAYRRMKSAFTAE